MDVWTRNSIETKFLVNVLCCLLSTKVLVLKLIGKLFAKFDIDLFIKFCENLRFFQMLKNVKYRFSGLTNRKLLNL